MGITEDVERSIRELISARELEAGGRLPSERTLARQLGAGRTTIRLVLSKLAAEGLIRSEHGRGYYSNIEDRATLPQNAESSLPAWTVRGERTIYDNRWVRLTLVDVEPPGVKRFEHHVVRLHHVAIAAIVDTQDRVLMLRRYRFVPERWGWELPGGIIEPGEDPASTAAREVEEETGWRPRGTLKPLLTYQPMVGMVDSPHELLMGYEADFIAPPKDVEESGKVAWIPLPDVLQMMERDELLGSGTLIALLHILAMRNQGG